MERNSGVFPGSCLFLGELKVHSVTSEPVPKKQRPHWQPITRLPLIATAIDGMLETTQEQLETLESVRPKPYVLDDHTVARLIRSFTTQLNDLGLYQEQLARWKRTELSAGQRQEVERLGGQLAVLREATQSVLSISDELKDSTIEKVLAKDDLELGLDFLLGRRKL